MWAGDDLHADNLADLGGGGDAGVGGGLYAGEVASEEHGDIAGADFFPAGEGDVCGLECGVSGLKEGAKPLALNHADSLVCHVFGGELMVGRLVTSSPPRQRR